MLIRLRNGYECRDMIWLKTVSRDIRAQLPFSTRHLKIAAAGQKEHLNISLLLRRKHELKMRWSHVTSPELEGFVCAPLSLCRDLPPPVKLSNATLWDHFTEIIGTLYSLNSNHPVCTHHLWRTSRHHFRILYFYITFPPSLLYLTIQPPTTCWWHTALFS